MMDMSDARRSSSATAVNARRLVHVVQVSVGAMALAALAGCAISPGQTMGVRSNNNDNGYVQLVPITPQLVTTQQASASAPAIPPALLDYRPQAYHIGPGDTLYITVWDHPELTSPAGSQQEGSANGRLVRPDGTLYYPYIGLLKVEGMTIEQARQAIASKLAHWIRNPMVDISVANYSSQHVVVEGALVKSGTQSLTTVPLTLGEAIANAGVDNQNANLSDVVLTRGDQTYHLDMSGYAGKGGPVGNIYLQAGDRVLVPYNDAQKVYVMGEVTRPQALRFKTGDITLTQALGDAGGLNEVTSKGMIYVVRGAFDKDGHQAQRPTVYQLDLKSPAAFALADGFDVKPGDVVFASAAGVTRWNRFLSQLLPLTSALSATAASNYYISK
ncbi:MAG: Polysaccharide export lipoprotein Wza [Rhodanobacteraceae bacterium]|jgi:polysaccharide export outer membrane protein|nr:MAG: Polysaccharide export lipoprotein Wza [Rhodanobacteraceae bacterium]